MAKRKRARQAKNKISGSAEPALIKVDPAPVASPPAEVFVTRAVTVVRSTLFSAEFEKVIDIIARDRVYRAMLARRRLMSPQQTTELRLIS